MIFTVGFYLCLSAESRGDVVFNGLIVETVSVYVIDVQNEQTHELIVYTTRCHHKTTRINITYIFCCPIRRENRNQNKQNSLRSHVIYSDLFCSNEYFFSLNLLARRFSYVPRSSFVSRAIFLLLYFRLYTM